MLLSSVNFVAKARTGKNKDVFDKKKDSSKYCTKTDGMCQECKKEIDEEDSIFQFPPSLSTDTKTKKTLPEARNPNFEENGCRVSVTTSDDLCLSVDQFYYTIGLKEEAMCDNTCIFRKKVLKTHVLPNGRSETVYFVLDCDQDFFLTTNKYLDLELNYFATAPSESTQDSRIFEVYFTDIGHCLIRPLLHKNSYLHHLDKALSVQPFDLNWRCPEEYFFHFNAVPEPVVPKRKRRVRKICNHICEPVQVCNDTYSSRFLDIVSERDAEVKPQSDTEDKVKTWSLCKPINSKLMEDMPERFYIELSTRKVCKNKKTFSNIFLGCFGGKSSRITVESS
ncbi:hypothetical protein ACF0H5_020390 [Mactra antiquata]